MSTIDTAARLAVLAQRADESTARSGRLAAERRAWREVYIPDAYDDRCRPICEAMAAVDKHHDIDAAERGEEDTDDPGD